MALTPLVRAPRPTRLVRWTLVVLGVVVIGLLVALPHYARLIDNKMLADPGTRSFTQVAIVQNDSWWWDETVTGVSAGRSDLRLSSVSIPDGGKLPSNGQIRITLRFQVRDCQHIKPGAVTVAVQLERAGVTHTESLSQEGSDSPNDALTACGLTSPTSFQG